MTPQEMQAQQQRAQMPGQEKMAIQGQRLQAMTADAHERDETAIIVSVINALGKIGALNEVLSVKRDVEFKLKQIEGN
jgi:hypothetical protein